MRLLLTLVAVAMLTFAVGCGPKEDGGTATTGTSGTQTDATSTDAGEMTLVSLNLPGMT